MFTVTQKYIFFVSGLRNLEVSTEKVTCIFASDDGIWSESQSCNSFSLSIGELYCQYEFFFPHQPLFHDYHEHKLFQELK